MLLYHKSVSLTRYESGADAFPGQGIRQMDSLLATPSTEHPKWPLGDTCRLHLLRFPLGGGIMLAKKQIRAGDSRYSQCGQG